MCLTAPRPSLHLARVRVGPAASQSHLLASLARLLTIPTRYNPNRTTTFSDQQVKGFPWVPLRPAQVDASAITTAPHPSATPPLSLLRPRTRERHHGLTHSLTHSLTHFLALTPSRSHTLTLSRSHALTLSRSHLTGTSIR